MKRNFFACALAIALLFGHAAWVAGQIPEREARPQESKTAPAAEMTPPKEESSMTEHTIKIGGQVIPYKATASTILLKNDRGEPTALMYSAAYTRSDVQDLSLRPIAFCYNGGPGSASMWLHMGAFGPRRVVSTDAAFTPPAPYSLVDNGESLLDKTDLVFIDAIGTGFSHAVGKAQNRDFYGIDEDVQSFGQFIVTYLSRNNRWNSPKFLIGESYGTFRSAALGNHLQSRYSVHLNGIVLISSVLDYGTKTFTVGHDLPYIAYIPSYAAVAWYHKALKNRPADLDAFVAEARQFARADYPAILFKGDGLTPEAKEEAAKKLSYFTGLSEDYWMKANLRVNLSQFLIELQRSRGLTTSRIDARFTGYTRDLLAEEAQGDPEGAAVGGAFTAMLNFYNRNELKFGLDKMYNTSSRGGDWNWLRGPAPRGGGFANVAPDLGRALTTNPRLLVQIENGYYDMATPFFATEYTIDHIGLPAELRSHIKFDYYQAGHMMYLQDESRGKLKNNVAAFIDRATQK